MIENEMVTTAMDDSTTPLDSTNEAEMGNTTVP